MTADSIRRAPAGPLVFRTDTFTTEELDAITAMGDALAPMKAQIAGRSDNTDHLRITRVAWIERGSATAWLYTKLERAVLDLNAQIFKFDLYGLIESFQYTVYEGQEGGHYSWHVDTGNDALEPRKISLSLQLSGACDYEGGELVLEAGEGPFLAEKGRGTLIAFPSYVMHRVMPVKAGTRKSLVIWVAGPPFR